MSDNPTGPTTNSKELLFAVLFAFLVPVALIAGLVYYATSASKPATAAAKWDETTDERIQKIGTLAIREASREVKTGEQVFAAQCSACHATGAAGSPKFGDAAAWAPRIKTGFSALLNSALKGKNAMGAQGGGDFSDYEIARAVTYMANAGGAKFPEPKGPAPSDAATK